MADLLAQTIVLNGKKIKVIPEEAGMYPSDDLPAHIEKLQKRMERKKRPARDDLSKGNVVVALEGAFSGCRVVFLKQVAGNKALCCGPSPVNGIPFFMIDERYLLRTSTILEFKEGVDIDTSGIPETRRDPPSKIEAAEPTAEQEKIEVSILKAVDGIKFMRKYLEAPFKMPEFKGVSSLKF